MAKTEKSESDEVSRKLKALASTLTLTASAVALAAQVVEHFRKPKAGENERTNAGTALLGLAVLRTLPGLIRSARSLAKEIKHEK